MAFAIRNLSVLAYANGFTLWHYKAGKDTIAETCVPDYFADAADMLAEGDLMMICAADNASIRVIAPAIKGEVRLLPLDVQPVQRKKAA